MRSPDTAFFGHPAGLAGERFTLADIALLSIVDFAGWIGISLPADASHLQDWHQRATARTA